MIFITVSISLGVTGDLTLVSATLDLDITEVELPAAEVPEPASLALFGIALLGFAGLRRTRRG